MITNGSHPISDKRRYSRVVLPLRVFVNTKGKNGDLLTNISKGGACFQSTHTFEENDFIFFHFSGDGDSFLQGVKFSILGRIVWHDGGNKGDGYTYGAQFTFFNDPFSEQQRTAMISTLNRYLSRE